MNPTSPRFPWLLFALVLAAVSAASIAPVMGTGFNGLIGQDAYAYFGDVVDSLVVDGAVVSDPRRSFALHCLSGASPSPEASPG